MNPGETERETGGGEELHSTDEQAAPAEDSANESSSGKPAEAAPPARRPRGFAAMDRDKVREIARLGGKAAHQAGTAHEFTSDEARAAGRNGGLATHAKRRARNEATAKP